jgi:hypothetical protein
MILSIDNILRHEKIVIQYLYYSGLSSCMTTHTAADIYRATPQIRKPQPL